MTNQAYIVDAVRTPVGKFGGGLSTMRPDDLAAFVIKTLMQRNQSIDPVLLDDVLMGCANQAGEDNRNIARMALLLAGIPESVPGATVNRLCGSGLDAVGMGARAIASGEADLVIAGGVESMTRAPFVLEKGSSPFDRNVQFHDTTLGWRFINRTMDKLYGTESMMQTAENIAVEMDISRDDQDLFAYRSQEKAAVAQQKGHLAREIVPVVIPQRKGDPLVIEHDEHLRLTPLEKLATLKPLTSPAGTITAGNASGINDGAAALLIASEQAVATYGLTPVARIMGMAASGVPPRIMGIGPVPATQKLLKRLNMTIDNIDLIELNEAFAAQALGCLRYLGIDDNDPRVNPLGGAIALGHPLGMSGARLATTALHQILSADAKTALCTMCIGVGQGISLMLEKA